MRAPLSILLIALLVCIQSGKSQPVLPAFGTIDIADLLMKECSFEKGASAMILFDYQGTTCDLDGYTMRIITERRVRIKILTDKGLTNANIKIPYLSRNKQTRIKEISGITYNLDSTTGKVVTQRIEKKQIFKDRSEDDLSKVSFTFPNVKPGSVIEYRYTKVEANSIFIDAWSFQEIIPVREAYCYVSLPGYAELKYRNRSKLPIEIFDPYKVIDRSEKKVKGLSLFAKEIPSFKAEPFMSSFKDNIPRVEFSLVDNNSLSDNTKWAILASRLNYSPFFGQQYKRIIKGTEKVIDTAKKFATKDEKVNYLYHYVQKNITWDQIRTFYSFDLEESWNKKKGSSADINLLIVNLLRNSGVYCVPVLASTRQNGKIDMEYVSLSQFNAVDVLVIDSTSNYLLDGTVKHTSYKIPPYNILNRDALVVDSLDVIWVSISDTRPLRKTMVSALASFDSSHSLIGDAAIISYDYAKEETLLSRDEDEDEEEKEERDRRRTELSIWDFSEENADDKQKPLIEKFKFKYQVTNSNELYYFNPLFLTSFNKNPFIAETRHTDIDMGCNQYFTFSISLLIPDDMEAESVPENILLRNSDSTIVFRRISGIENKRANMKISIDWNYPIFPKEDYPGIRDFYKKLYSLMNEQVVLKKIK